MIPALVVLDSSTLVHLSPVDLVIIVFYFALVLTIGFYLKEQANTGEDFFMAGREMTAWVAGLAFLSANLGSLELMGWAGNSYKYGILAAHWYWIGAIPAMLFLALVMMPFYHICKTHSVPGYLKLRFGPGSQALSSISFAFMTVLMSGINMYAMAVVMRVVLGWSHSYQHLGVIDHRSCLRRLRRPAICNLQRGPTVLSDLGGRIADSDSWIGGSRRLEWPQSKNSPESHRPAGLESGRLHARMVHPGQLWRQSDGHQLGRHCLRPRRSYLDGILDHRLSGCAARPRCQGSPLSKTGSHHWCGVQDDGAIHRDPSWPAGAGTSPRSTHGDLLRLVPGDLAWSEAGRRRGCTATTRSCP